MNAIKQVRKYLEQHPTRRSSHFLANLVEALGDEREIPLRDLYELDQEAFELAIELIKDWRLDRYYAARLKLFDFVTSTVIPEAGGAPAPAETKPAPAGKGN